MSEASPVRGNHGPALDRRGPGGASTVCGSVGLEGHVTVPKGGRQRRVPMTERLRDALKAARHLRGPLVVSEGNGEPVTQKVVQGTMRRVARRANVKPGVHILRHTFCSHLAMQGCPARAIQELAGTRIWRRPSATCT